jgi:MinD-like ATPase involved in chromosome partitioning or flagellar assembly
MGHIISVHSYRGGTGKSNLTANLAYQAALRGRRAAVLDTDVQSPGVHMVLGLAKNRLAHSLTDYLFGKCDLEDAAYNLTNDLDLQDSGGALFLIPSSMSVDSILRVASEGYDAGRLNDHMSSLVVEMNLDLLILDTHPGLNRETMLTTSISDALVVVVRPDTQDFHGTAVLMEVANRLRVPHTYMIVNKVPSRLDPEDVKNQVEKAFKHDVIAKLPLSEDMMVLGSQGLFTRNAPNHPISVEIGAALDRLLADLPDDS